MTRRAPDEQPVANDAALVELKEHISELEEVVEEKEREIDRIADIQQSLLPDAVPEITGLTIAASYHAPGRAGGDYYDFLPLAPRNDGHSNPDSRWLMVIADATGHGPGAAVIMTMVHSILHARPQPEDDPGKILRFVNEQMVAKELDQSFVTGLFAVFDPVDQAFSFACGGHPLPLIRRANGSVQELETPEEELGPLLGVISDAEFPTRKHRLNSGEMLMLYTDGAVEIMNAQDEQFGLFGLKNALASAPTDPQGAISHVHRLLAQHRGGKEQTDDTTILMLLAN